MAAPRALIVPRDKPPAAGAARKAGGKAGSWQAGVSRGLKGLSYDDQADTLQPSRESMKLPTAVVHPGLLDLQGERFRPTPEAGRAAKPAQVTATTTPATPAAPARSETGIASRVAIGRFNTAARTLTAEWDKLDVNGRGQKLGSAANAELKAAQVPETVIQVKVLPTNAGEFGFAGWTLDLNENLFQRPTIVPPLPASVADTVYHEARHCEQWYRMAQLEAGKGKDGAAIAQALSIPKRVGDLAAASPLQGTSAEGREAQTWYDSIYGALPPATTAAARQAAYDKAMASYAIWQRLNGEYDVLYRAYRALPEEADAWATGGAAGDAMRATP